MEADCSGREGRGSLVGHGSVCSSPSCRQPLTEGGRRGPACLSPSAHHRFSLQNVKEALVTDGKRLAGCWLAKAPVCQEGKLSLGQVGSERPKSKVGVPGAGRTPRGAGLGSGPKAGLPRGPVRGLPPSPGTKMCSRWGPSHHTRALLPLGPGPGRVLGRASTLPKPSRVILTLQGTTGGRGQLRGSPAAESWARHGGGARVTRASSGFLRWSLRNKVLPGNSGACPGAPTPCCTSVFRHQDLALPHVPTASLTNRWS